MTNNAIEYKGWNIFYNCKPIPNRRFDWEASHDEYDGAPDSGDDRAFCEVSVAACKETIDNWEIEHG